MSTVRPGKYVVELLRQRESRMDIEPNCFFPSGRTAIPSTRGESVLGTPLTIQQAAALIGCSVWNVRQRYMPMGLPYLRSGPNGKLIFYSEQIIAWVLAQQRKGGRR